MVILRRITGATLVSLLLFVGLVPRQLPQSGNARAGSAQQAREEQRKSKRVYTNDDWPFNQPRPAPPPSTGETGPTQLFETGRGGAKVAPFVPSPMEIVEKMLEVAAVTSQDVVYDLGSGDGRIVLLAAQKYGAKAVGVELDAGLAQESAERAKELKLEGLVSIIQGDLFQTNIQPATVVTIYLLPSVNERLRPIFEKELRPGSRVVAHDMRISGWEPTKEEAVKIGNGTHFVYLYKIPDAFRR